MIATAALTAALAFGYDPSTRLRNVPPHLTARMAAVSRGTASCAANAPGGGLRATPTAYGGDPTGTVDSTDAVQKALQFCINASNHIPGTFPVGARDAGGCTVDLEGGEFLISDTLLIPAYTSDIQIARGALVANPKSWTLQPVAHAAAGACRAGTFPFDRSDEWCKGMVAGTATTESECEDECCAAASCSNWMWCAPNAPCYGSTGNHSCWISAPGVPAVCGPGFAGSGKTRGWVGASRNVVPAPPLPAKKFMIQVGGDVKCTHPQGSCNEDVGFPQLFLDGSHVAAGILVVSVMGTTIGPSTYLLNFSNVGVEIVGGHEGLWTVVGCGAAAFLLRAPRSPFVRFIFRCRSRSPTPAVMITECWLGETNFDYQFNASTGAVPTATGILMHSNDHFVLNTIVFSSLIGLHNIGAANRITGLHVWFPVNEGVQFGETAFLNEGSGNRFDGCYIDSSVAVFANPSDTTWMNGYVLGGLGFHLTGATARNFVIQNTIFGGSGTIYADAGMMATNVWIGENPSAAKTSAATLSVTSAAASALYTFNFCSVLLFDTIVTVKSAVFSSDTPGKFPILEVGGASACPGSTTAMKVISVHLSVPVAGTVTLAADSSAQSM
jgi:hypothetical protein